MFGTQPPGRYALAQFPEVLSPEFFRTAGGNSTSTGEAPRRRDPRTRAGLVPPRKRPTAPLDFGTSRPIPLPPFRAPMLAPADIALPTLVDRDLTAQYMSDIQRLLHGPDQDEQDMRDIADVLALLD